MFDTLVSHVKDTFLAHVPNEEVNTDELAETVAYAVTYLEEKGMEASPENISAHADEITAYINTEKKGLSPQALSPSAEAPATTETRVEKLEKTVKLLSAAAWVFLAVVFLYIFTTSGPKTGA